MNSEAVTKIAQGVVARRARRAALIARLREIDMLGRDCSETVELERLDAEDIQASQRLADLLGQELGQDPPVIPADRPEVKRLELLKGVRITRTGASGYIVISFDEIPDLVSSLTRALVEFADECLYRETE